MTGAELVIRDKLRDTLGKLWSPLVDNRNSVDWTVDRERLIMWDTIFDILPEAALTLERFTDIDLTCTGHVDWFDKLTLRVADELLGLRTNRT